MLRCSGRGSVDGSDKASETVSHSSYSGDSCFCEMPSEVDE